MPRLGMASAAIRPERQRNLPVRELVLVHVDLEDAVGILIRANPDAPVPVCEPRRVPRMGHHGLEQFPIPIDEPRRFVEAGVVKRNAVLLRIRRVGLLLADPEPSRRIGIDRQCVGIHPGRLEQWSRLRGLPRNSSRASSTTRCAARRRRAFLSGQRNRRRTEPEGDTSSKEFPSFDGHISSSCFSPSTFYFLLFTSYSRRSIHGRHSSAKCLCRISRFLNTRAFIREATDMSMKCLIRRPCENPWIRTAIARDSTDQRSGLEPGTIRSLLYR